MLIFLKEHIIEVKSILRLLNKELIKRKRKLTKLKIVNYKFI